MLRGVTVPDPWWGTENEAARGKGYWETLRLATNADEGWHARTLRVPVEPRSVRAVGLDELLSEYVDRAVELARERGVYALIDYHRIGRYDTDAVDDRVRAFWKRVAPRYAGDSHVLFELFNEPTEPASGGIEAWRTWRDHAEPWVSLVRENAPDTPVVVGSPRWSSMTQYAAREPFSDDDVVYAAHVYPSWDPRTWEGTFGDPALSEPVFVTEWGYTDADDVDSHLVGTTGDWGRPFRRWLDAHDNVSWCARTFDSVWEPRMFDTDWSLLGGNAHMGGLVKRWLADRRTDHWPPETGGTVTPYDEGSNRAPPAPLLQVSDVGKTSARVSWERPSDPDGDDVLQYEVRVTGREPRTLRGSVTSVEIGGLDPGTAYEVAVTAVDEHGLGSSPARTTFGTVARVEPAATVPRAGSPPTVDGTVDDPWSAADPHPVDDRLWGAGVDPDLGGEWRALWDDSALYALVSVDDADVTVDSEQAWKDDTAELYLDLDNSRESSYDGVNDLHLIVRRGEEMPRPGEHSVTDVSGVDVGTAETDGGWRVELAVPWEPYGVAPTVGHRIGMAVHAVDDHDGGDRDTKVAWQGNGDTAWEDPTAFSVVELGG